MARAAKTKKKDEGANTNKHLFMGVFLGILVLAVIVGVVLTYKIKNPDDDPDKRPHTQAITEDGVFYAFLEPSPLHVTVPNCQIRYTPTEDGEYDKIDNECIDYYARRDQTRGGDLVIYGDEEDFEKVIIKDEDEFFELFDAYEDKYDDDFFSENYLISIVTHQIYCGGDIDRVYVKDIDDGEANVMTEFHSSCGPCADEAAIYLITVKRSYKIYSVKRTYTDTFTGYCDRYTVDKPVIYLYPTETTDIDIKLGNPEKLTVSYPKYVDAWRVIANPDGSLVDRATGRNLYALYYEAEMAQKGIQDEGFVVRGVDTVKFLEEKLAQLGLNEHEAEEFIIYWLPKMEQNAYNYIHFDTTEDVNHMMPLSVNPMPETMIRFYMEFKALDAPIEVKEQQLPETPIRRGFTLVEWGGTIL